MGAAESLSNAIGIVFTSEEENILADLRERLGDTRFEAFAAEGRAMTLDQTVAYSLQISEG